MNRKQTATKLLIGLIIPVLLMITGCDKIDRGMIDDNRVKLDPDGQMGMYIFLPDRDTDLNTFLKRLNTENWERWMSQFMVPRSEAEVALVMPKFKLIYSIELTSALKQLGMGIAFDGANADFSRMRVSPVPVFISYLNHHAIVEVNEEGTEASAGTVVLLDEVLATPDAAESIPPIPFVVDRPFSSRFVITRQRPCYSWRLLWTPQCSWSMPHA